MVNTLFKNKSNISTNTVFQQQHQSTIIHNKNDIYNENNNSNISFNTSQSSIINKYFKIIIDSIEELYIGNNSITYKVIENALEIIMKYLYDSSLSNNTFSHNALLRNIYNTFLQLLNELDNNTEEYIFLSNNMYSFSDNNQEETSIEYTLFLIYENIKLFLEKISNNDINPFNDYKKQIIQFDLLKQHILDSLNLYIRYFKNGDFNELNELFNEEQQNEIGQKLISNTLFTISQESLDNYTNTNQLFDQYRSFIFKVIDGLNTSIQLNKKNQNLTIQNNTLQSFDDILKDPELLNEYINTHYNNLNTNYTILEESVTLTQGLQLKPEYEKYIELYGFAPNGIYDSEKLQIIIKNLQEDSPSLEDSSSLEDSASLSLEDSASLEDSSSLEDSASLSLEDSASLSLEDSASLSLEDSASL